MNEFSRRDENQEAFMAWFNAVPAETKLAWFASYEVDELSPVRILRDAGQADGWLDSFIDQLYTFADEQSGQAKLNRAYNALVDLVCDGYDFADALFKASQIYGVNADALQAEYDEAEENEPVESGKPEYHQPFMSQW